MCEYIYITNGTKKLVNYKIHKLLLYLYYRYLYMHSGVLVIQVQFNQKFRIIRDIVNFIMTSFSLKV